MSLYANVNNSKKEVTGLFGNIDGITREIASLWANKDGTPVKIFENAPPQQAFVPKGYCLFIAVGDSYSYDRWQLYVTKDMESFYRLSSYCLLGLDTFYELLASNKKYYTNVRIGGNFGYKLTTDFSTYSALSGNWGNYGSAYCDGLKKAFITNDKSVKAIDNSGVISSTSLSVDSFEMLRTCIGTNYMIAGSKIYNADTDSIMYPSGDWKYGSTHTNVYRIKGIGDFVVAGQGSLKYNIYKYDDFFANPNVGNDYKIVDNGDANFSDDAYNVVYTKDSNALYFIQDLSSATALTITKLLFDGTYVTNIVDYSTEFAGVSNVHICIGTNTVNVQGKGILLYVFSRTNTKMSIYFVKKIEDLLNKNVSNFVLLAEITSLPTLSSTLSAYSHYTWLRPISDGSYESLISGKSKIV